MTEETVLTVFIRTAGFLLTVLCGAAVSLWMSVRADLFRFEVDEVHHLYAGILILSVVPAHAGVWPWQVLAAVSAVGLVLAMDDIFQHHVQVLDPSYRSPVHRLFSWLWSVL